MCKHILNAQASILAPCCKRFFDCPQCHQENSDHKLRKRDDMVLYCKKCKSKFIKNAIEIMEDEAEHHCPQCDNCFIIDAKVHNTAPAAAGAAIIGDARMPVETQKQELVPLTEEELKFMEEM